MSPSRRAHVATLCVSALLALAPARAGGAPRLELSASVDRTELSEDEVLTLTVAVDAEDGSPALDLRESELPFRILSRSWSTDVSVGLGGGAGVEIRRARPTLEDAFIEYVRVGASPSGLGQ